MRSEAISTLKPGESLARLYRSVESSPRAQSIYSWVFLVLGLVCWTVIQTVFTVEPVWNRALPTGIDNGLTYLVEARRMENCLVHDCPAMADLQRQFETPASSPQSLRERQRVMASVSPGHPTLVAVVLLALNKLGLDLMTAYLALYSIGPLWLGAAFAYLLSTLWGVRAAGISLVLLAFKLFPVAGLNYAAPSTIAMGVAVLVWARILSRRGNAPWTLLMGSIALVGIHPIGALYALVAAVITVSLLGWTSPPAKLVPAALTCFIALVSLALLGPDSQPPVPTPPATASLQAPVMSAVWAGVQSVVSIAGEVLSVEAGLFGSMTIFCGAVALGFFASRPDQRPLIGAMVAVLALFFVLFTLLRPHRGDLIPVLWVPLLVVLFGGVGQAFLFGMEQSFLLLIARLEGQQPRGVVTWAVVWPLLAFALVFGYSFQMAGAGIMHLLPNAYYLRDRQPLMLAPSQPELLQSLARPGDTVLYTSTIIMPYYLIHGAMQFGAVYHHPRISGQTSDESAASSRLPLPLGPALRFAVTYNPTVYHPTFEGSDEDQWWITPPPLRFSPLNKRKVREPISREGAIRAAEFKWIDIEPRSRAVSSPLKVMVKNPGPASRIQFVAMTRSAEPIKGSNSVHVVAEGWTGSIDFHTETHPEAERFRIIFPDAEPRLLIRGIVFGDDPFHWPWDQKADVTFVWKDAGMDPVAVSFDPARLLPLPLKRVRITVLNDEGSSVLLKIENDSST